MVTAQRIRRGAVGIACEGVVINRCLAVMAAHAETTGTGERVGTTVHRQVERDALIRLVERRGGFVGPERIVVQLGIRAGVVRGVAEHARAALIVGTYARMGFGVCIDVVDRTDNPRSRADSGHGGNNHHPGEQTCSNC